MSEKIPHNPTIDDLKKFHVYYDGTEIEEYLKDKSIVILGNAESIFSTKKDFSKYDVICRFNRAFPQIYVKSFNHNQYVPFIDKRTDILFLSGRALRRDIIVDILKPKFIVRTRTNQSQTDWLLNNSIYWGGRKWGGSNSWCSKINISPTSGCLALVYLLENVKFKDITIYGFDWCISPEHTHGVKEFPWYDGHAKYLKREEKYITELAKRYININLIRETWKKPENPPNQIYKQKLVKKYTNAVRFTKELWKENEMSFEFANHEEE